MKALFFELQRFSSFKQLTINDDEYSNTEPDVAIYGLEGNDTIKSSGSDVTVDGGTGNDVITKEDGSLTVSYFSGSGDDTIYGFDSEDAINLVSGLISSSVVSGKDIILKVGTGSITVVDGVYNDININFADGSTQTIKQIEEYPSWKVEDNVATYGNNIKTLVTITGINPEANPEEDFAFGDDNTVLISSNALSKNNISISGDYTLAFADEDVEVSEISDGAWTIKNTSKNSTATYTGAITEGYTMAADKKSIIYNEASDSKVLATITGLKKGAKVSDFTVNSSDFYSGDNNIAVSKRILPTTAVKMSGVYFNIALGSDVTESKITPAGFYISDTTATYKTAGRNTGYYIASNGKSIAYRKAAASKVLTKLTGLKSGVTSSDLTLKGKNVILSENALGATVVKISGSYNLALASTITKSTTTKAHWTISGTTATYTSTKVTEGYVLASNKKSISYKTNSGGDVVVTLEGIRSGTAAKYLTIKGTVVTLSKNALNPGSGVTLTGNYTLALGSDVTKSKTTNAGWTISNTTAVYKTTKITTGYKLASDKKSISYETASGGETLVTVTGLKKGLKANALSLSDDTVTLTKAALGTTTVKVSGDYKLALADGIAAPEVTDAHWDISGTTAKYITTKTTAGYTVSDDAKSVTYTKAGGGATAATISDLTAVTTEDSLLVNDKTITLAANAVSETGVRVNGSGYTFELASAGKMTNVGAAASLCGSSGNDTLTGGAGNDYIAGGAGDDYLTGGKGNDTFVYGGGNDLITDYTAGQDRIKISETITSTSVSGNNVSFITASGTLTVQGAKGKRITLLDANNKATTKTISKNVSELWFDRNNTFATSDNLDSITETQSVGEVEMTENKKVAQENLITYAK